MAEDLLAGLPDGVRTLLAAPPATEKKLLELRVARTGLPAAQAWMAERLRVFVITWDPLELSPPRPNGFTTLNVDPSGSELVVYVPIWSMLEQADEQSGTVTDVLAAMAGSAVVTALTPTAHPVDGRAGRGAAPDRPAGRSAGAGFEEPEIGLVSPGWEDIGLGAITDVVQASLGAVDLDRSPVELAGTARPQHGCPACGGRRFGFPGELGESRTEMCRPHRAEAEKVIRVRLARASASNPDGWGALADASIRLSLPHLPNGMVTKLAATGHDSSVAPGRAVLAERARLVVEATGSFRGRRNDFTVALGAEPELAGQLPDWLLNLVLELGRAGLGAEAAAVAEALTRMDPDLRAMLDGDVAVALAQAGLADQARGRIESNLARWPHDVWIRIHVGDALLALDDLDGAAAHFDAAVTMAEDTDDRGARSAAVQRLRRIGRPHLSDQGPGNRPRRQPRRQSRSRRKHER